MSSSGHLRLFSDDTVDKTITHKLDHVRREFSRFTLEQVDEPDVVDRYTAGAQVAIPTIDRAAADVTATARGVSARIPVHGYWPNLRIRPSRPSTPGGISCQYEDNDGRWSSDDRPEGTWLIVRVDLAKGQIADDSTLDAARNDLARKVDNIEADLAQLRTDFEQWNTKGARDAVQQLLDRTRTELLATAKLERERGKGI